jgi:hypothetical protein
VHLVSQTKKDSCYYTIYQGVLEITVVVDTLRKLRRQLGRKVLELGGNSVLGYHQDFDLEGESGQGIVARGYGTACLLRRVGNLIHGILIFYRVL